MTRHNPGYWDAVATGHPIQSPPPYQNSDRAALIGVVLIAVALFLYFTNDRPGVDINAYAPAYATTVAEQTPSETLQSPLTHPTPVPRLRTQPTPEIAVEGRSEAQDTLDELYSLGMPACGEPISIAGQDDLEPAYC